MDHIEIDLVELQLPQAGVERTVERIRRKLVMPDLGGDKELVAVHAGRRDGRADGGLVVVHRSGVDMSVAERDRALDDRLGTGSRHPEGAEAEARNRDTLCRDRFHDVFLCQVSYRRDASINPAVRREAFMMAAASGGCPGLARVCEFGEGAFVGRGPLSPPPTRVA